MSERRIVFGVCAIVFAPVPTSAQSTTRVSVDSSGVEGHAQSVAAAISADGRVVAFSSLASDLVTGDLLVLTVVVIPVGVPQAGLAFTGTLPHDYRLCGVTVDLQAIEGDAGAAHGVSFTPGLELVPGH